MAIRVTWSIEANETFSQNVNYLIEHRNDSEASKFIQQTQAAIKRIQIFPESYPQGNKNKKYRKARLNKYTVMFYRYYKSKSEITIITFWNVKQHPDKLKY